MVSWPFFSVLILWSWYFRVQNWFSLSYCRGPYDVFCFHLVNENLFGCVFFFFWKENPLVGFLFFLNGKSFGYSHICGSGYRRFDLGIGCTVTWFWGGIARYFLAIIWLKLHGNRGNTFRYEKFDLGIGCMVAWFWWWFYDRTDVWNHACNFLYSKWYENTSIYLM